MDTNHTDGTDMRQYQTGILLLCNKSKIIWFIKRQNLVEASTFGSEFTSMKNTVYLIEALCYKLHMFRVPIDVPTNIFCNNGAICANTTHPESTLENNHHRISYYLI